MKIGVFVGLYYVLITAIQIHGISFVLRYEYDVGRAMGMVYLITRGLTMAYFFMIPVFFNLLPEGPPLGR